MSFAISRATRGYAGGSIGRATRGYEFYKCKKDLPSGTSPFSHDCWRGYFDIKELINSVDDTSSWFTLGMDCVNNKIEINGWDAILDYGNNNTVECHWVGEFECTSIENTVETRSHENKLDVNGYIGGFEVKL